MLHESYMDDTSHDRLQVEAIRHYNNAMRSISQDNSPNLSTNAVLISVTLFHIMESLRGDFQRALQHARSGLKILCEKAGPARVHRQSALNEALQLYFIELQNRISEVGDVNNLTVYTIPWEYPEEQSMASLDTVDDCLVALEVGTNLTWGILKMGDRLQEADADQAEALEIEMHDAFGLFMSRAKGWTEAIDRLAADPELSKDEELSTSVLMLQIYQAMVSSQRFRSPETTWPEEGGLARSMELCEKYLERYNDKSAGQRFFSLATGVLRTLFQISMRTSPKAPGRSA